MQYGKVYKRRVEMHCLASGFVRTLLSTYALLLHAVHIADLNVLSHLVKEFEVQKPQRPHSIFSFQVKEVEVSCVTGRRAQGRHERMELTSNIVRHLALP